MSSESKNQVDSTADATPQQSPPPTTSGLNVKESLIGGRGWAIAVETSMLEVWTIAADLWIFRAHGFFAAAVFFAIAIGVVHRLRDDVPWHRHRYQYRKTALYRRLSEQEAKWERYLQNPDLTVIARLRFRDYAMQWY